MSVFGSFAALAPIFPVVPNFAYSESRSITYKEATQIQSSTAESLLH